MTTIRCAKALSCRPPFSLGFRSPCRIREVSRRLFLVLASLIFTAAPALAHPAPFSYLDIVFRDGEITGTLVVHVIDLAHDLGFDPPERLLDREVLNPQRQKIVSMLGPRMTLRTDHRLNLQWVDAEPLPDDQAIYDVRDGRGVPPPWPRRSATAVNCSAYLLRLRRDNARKRRCVQALPPSQGYRMAPRGR
jgi:hypothetical protein